MALFPIIAAMRARAVEAREARGKSQEWQEKEDDDEWLKYYSFSSSQRHQASDTVVLVHGYST